MSDRLQELGIFVRAAETGSFSRAARELGTTQPSVSRTIAGLERRLGVKLLLRTTRRITLTDAGSVLLERARHILPEIDEAEDAARGTDSLRGLLKVAMPVAFGIREVIPRLQAFLADHPQLRIDFVMADGAEDLVAEGVDVALRLGQLADSGFGSRKLASVPRYLVASPGYLELRGTPASLADLDGRDCILGPGASGRKGWVFRDGKVERPITGDERFNVGSAEGVIALAKAGLGMAVASLWMCRAELAAGHLVSILSDYPLAPAEVHAVFPAGRQPSRKVRAFTAHLADRLRGD
ncbi:LysR family transcriptional regulator [Lichenifustis flavocetrariae]|uniref:LysR family transcriptional regulator n=1 Tax=Lichenifustis flavocetrariae TaxID=2949735 RepID=A0AA42CL63_9HYPH|nr:LysR family transcriptional regulator [Lichenifustis flavocetrariae]MCW6511268.1 LysR family transcriptional regulator [Lichenifustis flavocetrariae]